MASKQEDKVVVQSADETRVVEKIVRIYGKLKLMQEAGGTTANLCKDNWIFGPTTSGVPFSTPFGMLQSDHGEEAWPQVVQRCNEDDGQADHGCRDLWIWGEK